ncbi:hypothetical protein BD413DRAFT_490926 [Trametes elegans]|nr:hypothetical protein BD413DRAFT_490926 [Trametes elegans]
MSSAPTTPPRAIKSRKVQWNSRRLEERPEDASTLQAVLPTSPQVLTGRDAQEYLAREDSKADRDAHSNDSTHSDADINDEDDGAEDEPETDASGARPDDTDSAMDYVDYSDQDVEEETQSVGLGESDDFNGCPIHDKPYRRRVKPPRRIGPLVNMDGTFVVKRLDYESRTESIPACLHKTLTAPYKADFDLANGRQAFSKACRELCASESGFPKSQELELIDPIIARATPTVHVEAIGSVCRIAQNRRDVKFWLRGVRAHDGVCSVSTLDWGNLYRALELLGFEDIQSRIEDALRRDPSDVAVLQFLQDLENRPLPVNLLKDGRHRRANTTPEVVAAFVYAAAIGSAASLVFTSLIPRVATAGADMPTLRALIDDIGAQRPLLDSDGHALASIVPQLLAHCSVSVQLGSDVPPADRVENVYDAVRYCLSFDCPGLAGELIGRVVKPDSTVDKKYIMDTLEPVLAGLPSIMRRKNMLLSSNFTPHIGSILLYWGTTIMGPPPGGITASRQALEEFEAWQCACGKKNAAMVKPVQWAMYQKRGIRLFRGLSSDVEELYTALGQDGGTIVSLLAGQPAIALDSSDPSTPSRVDQIQEALSSLLGTTPPSPILIHDFDDPAEPSERGSSPVSHASIPTRSHSPMRASSLSDPEPPFKRRRETAYDPDDVMDLT